MLLVVCGEQFTQEISIAEVVRQRSNFSTQPHFFIQPVQDNTCHISSLTVFSVKVRYRIDDVPFLLSMVSSHTYSFFGKRSEGESNVLLFCEAEIMTMAWWYQQAKHVGRRWGQERKWSCDVSWDGLKMICNRFFLEGSKNVTIMTKSHYNPVHATVYTFR